MIDCDKKVAQKFCCINCDYNTDKKSSYDKHLKTKKHFVTQKVAPPSVTHYKCKNCDKIYSSRNGLWCHSKKCITQITEKNISPVKNENYDKDEIIMMLLKQNSDILKGHTDIIKEQSDLKQLILEIVKNGTHNIVNNNVNNSNNKTFNLQFFLNETCKNAMNISDFVDSINIQLSDFEKVGQQGFIQGISNIIVDNLNALDVTLRPIHCTDKKREVIYIKDKGQWEKDDEKKRIRGVVKRVVNKNRSLICQFRDKYPECKQLESKLYNKYNKMIIEVLGGDGDNIIEKEDKIIRNISNNVTIDKLSLSC